MKKINQRGNVVVYILIAIFLMSLLIATLTGGTKKSATTEQVDELTLFLQQDISTIQQAITECVEVYSKPTDVNGDNVTNTTDNPNSPFPLYGAGADTLANLSSGGTNTEATTDTGNAITSIRCPGAPDGQRTVLSGNFANQLKALADTTTYTTTYFNNTTEGAYIRITRASADSLWTEAISRLNNKYSKCQAAAVTAAGTCVNGCFYYWIVRLPTSTLGGEAGCP